MTTTTTADPVQNVDVLEEDKADQAYKISAVPSTSSVSILDIPEYSQASDGVVYYKIISRGPAFDREVMRRFNDFEKLETDLKQFIASNVPISSSGKTITIPALFHPYTKAMQVILGQEKILNERKKKLMAWLQAVIQTDQAIANSYPMLLFLRQIDLRNKVALVCAYVHRKN